MSLFVKQATNKKNVQEKKIPLFKFPTDNSLREKWIKAISQKILKLLAIQKFVLFILIPMLFLQY